MKKYLMTTKTDGAKSTQIKVDVYYSKGGTSYFSGAVERRGYWLSVLPVEVEDMGTYKSEAFMLFGNKGLRMFLLEVKRQSPKAEAEAVRLAAEKEAEVVAQVLAKSGLTVAV